MGFQALPSLPRFSLAPGIAKFGERFGTLGNAIQTLMNWIYFDSYAIRTRSRSSRILPKHQEILGFLDVLGCMAQADQLFTITSCHQIEIAVPTAALLLKVRTRPRARIQMV